MLCFSYLCQITYFVHSILFFLLSLNYIHILNHKKTFVNTFF
nr:MAG TPA: hypothetical protein [Caudoviricetes sp.]DAY44480.1 MAG TPA: hypothetical protein [Caudoviricetes sp.]